MKAIDFGLAVPFNPACLPLSVSMLEGTPWCAMLKLACQDVSTLAIKPWLPYDAALIPQEFLES